MDELERGTTRAGTTELDHRGAVLSEVTACRTAALRTERRVVTLAAHHDAVRFLNRPSHLLFVLAQRCREGRSSPPC
jgi:cob(I)alamin adenosyltransferase